MRVQKNVRAVKLRSILQAAMSIGLVLVLAQVLLQWLAPDHRYWLTPWTVLSRLPYAWQNGLLGHVGGTLYRSLLGFLIASTIGVGLGVLIGRSRFLLKWAMPIVDLCRPLPSAAILPIAMLILGLGERMYLFVIVFGGVWPILLDTIIGVRYVDSTMQDAVAQMRFGPVTRLWTFVLPEAAAEITSGLRISLSVCLILTVTAELFVGSGNGLGRFMSLAQDGGDYALMYFLVIVIALVGWVLNRLLDSIISWMPWMRYQYQSEVEPDRGEGRNA